MSEPISTSKGR